MLKYVPLAGGVEVTMLDEYAKGVFECLSWIEALMAELDEKDDKWTELQTEVGEIIYEIRRGVGVDFRNRLRARF
jgi:hypothetical protein